MSCSSPSCAPSPDATLPGVSARLSIAILLFAAAFARAQETLELADDGSWTPVRVIDPDSDEGVVARARALIADDQPALAKRVLNAWIDDAVERNSPWLAQAYLARGDAKAALGDEFDAMYDYEKIVKEFPSSDAYIRALERQCDISIAYVHGLRRRFLGLRIMRSESQGEAQLVLIQQRLPNSALAERAALELADYYYRTGEVSLAQTMYEIFLINFPESRHRAFATSRLVYSSMARAKGPRHDASGLLNARAIMRAFAARNPTAARDAQLTDALDARIDEALGAKLLETARWYIARDDDLSARFTLRRLLAKHPATVAAAQATQLMIEKDWIEPPEPPRTPGPPIQDPAP